jgi:ParB-like chromosome segregation protein Spo0J
MASPRLEAHEIATLFPSMSEVDLDHLRESIAKEGQLEEVITFEGKILDGRHRYEVCLELGVEPRLRAFEGTAAEAFAHSVALNLSRRHLTTVQRAAAGAGIKAFQARMLAAPAQATETEAEAEAVEEAPPPDGEPAVEIDVSIDEAPPPEASEPKTPRPAKGPSPRTINAKARALASQRVGVSGRAIDEAEKIKEAAPDVFERMLAGTAGSLPDAKRLTALPPEAREKVHALVDEGKDVKAAMREVAPPPPREDGGVFLGRVALEPAQARAFAAAVEARGLTRAEAAREALLEWAARHAPAELAATA